MACTTASSQAKTPIQFSGTIDYGAARYVNGASTPIKNVLNGKLHDCIEDLVSTDKQLSGIIKMVDVDAQLDFNILTDIIPSYLDPSNAGQYGYEVMEDDYGAKLYLKVAEYGEDKVRGEIIDFTKDKLTTFLIDGKHISAAENIDSYFSFVEVLGYADKLITWDNNRVSLEDARQAVLASSMGETARNCLQGKQWCCCGNGAEHHSDGCRHYPALPVRVDSAAAVHAEQFVCREYSWRIRFPERL